MIRFNCSSCGKLVEVPDQHAGKQGKCPHCQTLVEIPQASVASPGAWYYAVSGQRQGPLSAPALAAQIQAGQLPPTVQVWRSGMDNWAPANTLAEFQQVAAPSAIVPQTPAPPAPVTVPPAGRLADKDSTHSTGLCDICNTPGMGTIIKAADMSRAVKNEFNPIEEGLVPDLMKLMGLGGSSYDQWRQEAISGRLAASDWNVCSKCMKHLIPYLGKDSGTTHTCDFCGRAVSSNEQIAMLGEEALEKMEAAGALRRSGPASVRDLAGISRWIACSRCMGRATGAVRSAVGVAAPSAIVPQTPAPPAPVTVPPAGRLVQAGTAAVRMHQLSTFPVAVVILLHYVTIGIFTTIWLNLMHGKMPKIRHDDPSAGKAIGFLFIPFFNIYWVFFTYCRLCDRINEQRTMRGLPASVPKGMAIAMCILMLIPCVGILCWLILAPIFVGILQAKVNELVRHTPAGPAAAAASGTSDPKVALAEARMSAQSVASLGEIDSDWSKKKEIVGIIQNLDAAVRALDAGHDDQGRPITPSLIGEGLQRMLGDMKQHGIWFRLHLNAGGDARAKLYKLAKDVEEGAKALRRSHAMSASEIAGRHTSS